MSNDIQPQDLIFENVVPTDEQIITLYELLKQRTHNISHSVIPRFSEHSNFVRYNPYRAWFLLYLKDRYIGSIYITLENVLGVNILDPYIEICLETVVAKVMSEIDPLPLLPSVLSLLYRICLACVCMCWYLLASAHVLDN